LISAVDMAVGAGESHDAVQHAWSAVSQA